MAKGLSFERYDEDSLSEGTKPSERGRLFVSKRIVVDLSHILICGASVDTVRQLYRGILRADVLESIKLASESSAFLMLGGVQYAVGRMGKASGYRFRLQNNDEGVILLIGSYFVEDDKEGNHLKIELSPHFLSQRGVKQVQARLAMFACQLLSTQEPTGCAVHLALDVQGWKPDADFESRFRTRARAVRDYDGISELQFSGLSEVVCVYGKGQRQSYMFGKANALQTVVYEKSKEVVHSDKVDYFKREWESYTFGQYDPSQPVWRVEMRLHHNVIAEIAEGQGETWKTFAHVANHLTDIWRYCLNTQRLDYSSVYIDPVWQLFRDDPVFVHPASGLWIRRKKKQDQSAIGRNYGIILGNLITVLARQQFNVHMILYELKKLRFYPDMLEYYANNRKMTEDDLRDFILQGITKRRLLGKAA